MVLDIIDCDNMSVGVVQSILIRNEDVYLVTTRSKAVRNLLQYFESAVNDHTLHLISVHEIVDYKPLLMRGSLEKFIFVLHHFISFEYK